jgi:hypothetical protein
LYPVGNSQVVVVAGVVVLEALDGVVDGLGLYDVELPVGKEQVVEGNLSDVELEIDADEVSFGVVWFASFRLTNGNLCEMSGKSKECVSGDGVEEVIEFHYGVTAAGEILSDDLEFSDQQW